MTAAQLVECMIVCTCTECPNEKCRAPKEPLATTERTQSLYHKCSGCGAYWVHMTVEHAWAYGQRAKRLGGNFTLEEIIIETWRSGLAREAEPAIVHG